MMWWHGGMHAPLRLWPRCLGLDPHPAAGLAPADIYTDLNDFDAAAKYYDKYIERMNADSVV